MAITVNTSTFYDAKYDRSKFTGIYDVEVGKGKQAQTIKIVDKLDNRYIELIDNCKSFSQHVVIPSDNLPNIAYKYYQNTTVWWIIARVNGIIDPLSLTPGDVLLIPDISEINEKVSNADTANIGKVVEF